MSDPGHRFEELTPLALASQEAAELARDARFVSLVRVGQATVAVRFSSGSTADAFSRRYDDQRGVEPAEAVAYVVERGDQAWFWLDASRVWWWRDGALAPELAAFFADNATFYEYLCRSPLLGLHAAVVANEVSAAAIVGATTAGKSTTALASVRRGLRLYSDERCILEAGRVVPFLRRLTLRRGGRELLLAESVDDPLGLVERFAPLGEHAEIAARPRALLGDRVGVEPLPLRCVFVLDGRGEAPRLERTDVYGVLQPLLAAMASREGGIDRIARLVRELRGAAIYRLRLGSPDASAQFVKRALSGDEA